MGGGPTLLAEVRPTLVPAPPGGQAGPEPEPELLSSCLRSPLRVSSESSPALPGRPVRLVTRTQRTLHSALCTIRANVWVTVTISMEMLH